MFMTKGFSGRKAALLAAALLGSTSLTACNTTTNGAGGTVSATDAHGVAQVLRDNGYRAEMDREDNGRYSIHSATQGARFSIYFYDCDTEVDCHSLLFVSYFTVEDGPDLNSINEWNAEMLTGKGFIDDEGDYGIDMLVSTKGGISAENFADYMEWWEYSLGEYIEHIGW